MSASEPMAHVPASSLAVTASPQAVLARHGRSFRWAQVFLPLRAAADAAVVYAFCRTVDDLADDAPDPVAARAALDRLACELRGEAPASPEVAALLDVLARADAPVDPALALVTAVTGDLGVVHVADDPALLRYAWGVAGTVGLLMAPVLGAAPGAAAAAESLGIAMQLTNICRDVAEDAWLGRVYLPVSRLQAAGRPGDPGLLVASGPDARRSLAALVADLLDLADTFYGRARGGYAALPWRSRVAVAVAAALYRRIGVRLRRLGGDPLRGRVVVPWWEKVGVVLVTLATLPWSTPAPTPAVSVPPTAAPSRAAPPRG